MRRAVLLAVAVAVLLLAPLADARTGALDRSFASGAGWRTLQVGASDSAADALLVTRRGKLLLGGEAATRGYGAALGFARLHPSGRLDRRFGQRGRTIIGMPGYHFLIAAMEELGDGRVLVAFHHLASGDRQEFGVLRLLADGRLDPTYGTQGVARLPVPGWASLKGMTALPDGGAALVGAVALPPDDRRTLVGRLDPDGRPVGEVAALSLGGAMGQGVAALPDGRVIVAATREAHAGLGPLLTTLFEVGADGQPLPAPRLEVPGARVVDVERDRTGGVGVLLQGNGRWGVRRYTASLAPRRAPSRLPSRGFPNAMGMGPGGMAWVAQRGRVARVRSDGRPDLRWGVRGRGRPLRTDLLILAADVVALPRGRVAAAGRAAEEGDIREDYGDSDFWVGVWR